MQKIDETTIQAFMSEATRQMSLGPLLAAACPPSKTTLRALFQNYRKVGAKHLLDKYKRRCDGKFERLGIDPSGTSGLANVYNRDQIRNIAAYEHNEAKQRLGLSIETFIFENPGPQYPSPELAREFIRMFDSSRAEHRRAFVAIAKEINGLAQGKPTHWQRNIRKYNWQNVWRFAFGDPNGVALDHYQLALELISANEGKIANDQEIVGDVERKLNLPEFCEQLIFKNCRTAFSRRVLDRDLRLWASERLGAPTVQSAEVIPIPAKKRGIVKTAMLSAVAILIMGTAAAYTNSPELRAWVHRAEWYRLHGSAALLADIGLHEASPISDISQAVFGFIQVGKYNNARELLSRMDARKFDGKKRAYWEATKAYYAGLLALTAGDYETASVEFLESSRLYQSIDYKYDAHSALSGAAEANIHRGDLLQAARWIEEAGALGESEYYFHQVAHLKAANAEYEEAAQISMKIGDEYLSKGMLERHAAVSSSTAIYQALAGDFAGATDTLEAATANAIASSSPQKVLQYLQIPRILIELSEGNDPSPIEQGARAWANEAQDIRFLSMLDWSISRASVSVF